MNALELRVRRLQVGLSSFHIGFCPIDLFGPGSTFQFLQARIAPSYADFGLIILSAVFAIFEPHDDLIAPDAIAFSTPIHATRPAISSRPGSYGAR